VSAGAADCSTDVAAGYMDAACCGMLGSLVCDAPAFLMLRPLWAPTDGVCNTGCSQPCCCQLSACADCKPSQRCFLGWGRAVLQQSLGGASQHIGCCADCVTLLLQITLRQKLTPLLAPMLADLFFGIGRGIKPMTPALLACMHADSVWCGH
jgi:hypothetical protein